jgi:cardiolipin synthase C
MRPTLVGSVDRAARAFGRRKPLAMIVSALLVALSVLGAAASISGGCARVPRETSKGALPRERTLHGAFSAIPAPSSTSHVELLSDPALAWGARWEILKSAQSRVDAAYFIAENDVFGLAFLGQLTLLSQRGVQVRLVVDSRGSGSLVRPLAGRDWLEELAGTENAVVYVFNTTSEGIARAAEATSVWPALASSHKKILAVDGAIAITGGRNLAADYFSSVAEEPNGFLDSDVRFDGAAAVARIVAEVDAEIEATRYGMVMPDVVNVRRRAGSLGMIAGAMDAWLEGRVPREPADEAVVALARAGAQALGERATEAMADDIRPHLEKLAALPSLWGILPLSPPPRHRSSVRIVSEQSIAHGKSQEIEEALVTAVVSAKREILIESPYLVLTPRLFAALQQASERHVPITVLTNGPVSSDNAPSQSLFIDTWPELMAQIPTLQIRVRAERPTLHAKRAIFDSELTLIGTYNLDPLSAWLNSELVLAVWSRGFARENRKELVALLEDEGTLEYRIARDRRGQPRRHAADHPQAGEVIVLFGPRDHAPAKQMQLLEAQKGPLLKLAAAIGLDVVSW